LPRWPARDWPAFAPYAYILRRRAKRFLKFREKLPGRSGFSGASAARRLSVVGCDGDDCGRKHCRRYPTRCVKTSTEANLGMGWNRALDNLGRRIPLLEVNLFASAVQLHARTAAG